MSDRTGISWTSATWNPTTGCDRVSEGCDHCYALTLAARLKAMGNPRYQTDGDPRRSGPGFGLTLHWDKLDQPIHWRSPRRIFVNSMSDLGHEAIPFAFFAPIFETMAATPQHTYQVLTKRPAPLASRVRRWYAEQGRTRPLHNVWLGVSVENQRWADVRVPALLRMPAAVRFLSCEPLLGPVDLRLSLSDGIDWVIVGGESGPSHRDLDPGWARSLRDQCAEAGVAFFYKQGSGARPEMDRELDGRRWEEMPDLAVAEPSRAKRWNLKEGALAELG
jgi:protein gp37